MKKVVFLILSLCLLMACSTKKSDFEESAGNLEAEFTALYKFYKAFYSSTPETAAKAWCKKNSSWNNEGSDGYTMTENEQFVINSVTFESNHARAIYYGNYSELCRVLDNLYGEPFRGHEEYKEWLTGDDFIVSAEKGGLSHIICIEKK
ncbi:MAG: hypothetical protein IJS63_03200 [Bacteroidaceae bacterium]|nr:hypothetical protein [Bacteroidaceae bacterium]